MAVAAAVSGTTDQSADVHACHAHVVQSTVPEAEHEIKKTLVRFSAPTCQALCRPTGPGSGGLPLAPLPQHTVLFRDQSETGLWTSEQRAV
jgi:hypothetical protein